MLKPDLHMITNRTILRLNCFVLQNRNIRLPLWEVYSRETKSSE